MTEGVPRQHRRGRVGRAVEGLAQNVQEHLGRCSLGGVLSAATQSGTSKPSRIVGDRCSINWATLASSLQRKRLRRDAQTSESWRHAHATTSLQRARSREQPEGRACAPVRKESAFRCDRAKGTDCERRDRPRGTAIGLIEDGRERARSRIGAEQQMLAVVQREVVTDHERARPPSVGAPSNSATRKPLRASSIAAAHPAQPPPIDSNHPRHAARVAIQSLRSGVQRDARSSTR